MTASVIHVAREEDLGTDDDIGPLSFSHDFDSVAHATGGGEGPACAAVNGDVLVSLNGQVVDSTDVTPPEIGRNF